MFNYADVSVSLFRHVVVLPAKQFFAFDWLIKINYFFVKKILHSLKRFRRGKTYFCLKSTSHLCLCRFYISLD